MSDRKGAQPVEATCRLPADGGHHELHILLAVTALEDSRDHVQQSIVQALLVGVKSIVTVSGLRVVNSPMSRRRVRLIK